MSPHDPRSRRRRGAVLSIELLFVLPIALTVLLAIIEFSMLWSARQLVEAAAAVGCREATYPGASMPTVRRAIERSLVRRNLIESYRVEVQGGARSGDEVQLVVRVPMATAAPDLLAMFGYRLQDQEIVAQAVMRRE